MVRRITAVQPRKASEKMIARNRFHFSRQNRRYLYRHETSRRSSQTMLDTLVLSAKDVKLLRPKGEVSDGIDNSNAQGSVSPRLDQLTGRLQARDLSQKFPNCGRQILQARGLSQKGLKWLVPRTCVCEGDDAFFHMVPRIHCNGSAVRRAFGSHDAVIMPSFALVRHHDCPDTPCFETQHYDA